MKMYHLTVLDEDMAQMEFGGRVGENDYWIMVLAVEDTPQIIIKRDGEVLSSERVRSIDDMKIFLEERLYAFLGR